MNIYLLNPTYALGSNSYVLESSGEYALIDPSVNPDSVHLDFSAFKYVILTHTHFDHMLFIDEWIEKTGAELIVGEKDAEGLINPNISCYMQFLGRNKTYNGKARTVTESDLLPLGCECIKIIETPGHTRGSITLLTDTSLFVGDTVFSKYSYGRCDLPGGDFDVLRRSIDKICSFPDDYTLYPGHGNKITVSELKK
jgi:glyoxylase-like metal-dependent hydrolase (beta-lactamase superfamily II)